MNIVLCGFMGSGKTVVGKELAKIMGRRFVDTDQLVEARSGVSIPAIFQVHGEDYFRGLERAACAEAAEIPFEVLSRVMNRIINEVKGVNRVMYDLTSKPPGTIEFE